MVFNLVLPHVVAQRISADSIACSTSMNQPIRILELRSADGAGGGPEKTILGGARLSAPEEFDIHVVYLKSESDTDSNIREKADSLDVRFSEITHHGPLDFGQFSKLRKYVAEHEFDIVHSHEYKSNFAALMLRRRFSNLKILSTAHGWTGSSFRERRIYYPADKRLLRYFPLIVSVSSEITDELIAKGISSDRIVTIPNGIDPELFRRDPTKRQSFRREHHINQNDVVIGAVGRLERQKRFDVLLTAFSNVAKQSDQDVKLLIAGEGSLREALRQQIQQLDLGEKANLLGHFADIQSLFSGIDIFVQSSDYEGTSNAILEAMAMEVPIVATHAGGTKDILVNGKHGTIVPINRPDRLESAIYEIIQRPDQAIARVKDSRALVENELSFKKRNQLLEGLYRQLVNGAPTQSVVDSSLPKN